MLQKLVEFLPQFSGIKYVTFSKRNYLVNSGSLWKRLRVFLFYKAISRMLAFKIQLFVVFALIKESYVVCRTVIFRWTLKNCFLIFWSACRSLLLSYLIYFLPIIISYLFMILGLWWILIDLLFSGIIQIGLRYHFILNHLNSIVNTVLIVYLKLALGASNTEK